MASPISSPFEARRTRELRCFPWFLIHKGEVTKENPTCRQFLTSNSGQLVLALALCELFMVFGLPLVTITSTTQTAGFILIVIALSLKLALAVVMLIFFFPPKQCVLLPPQFHGIPLRQGYQERSPSQAGRIGKFCRTLQTFLATISGKASFSLLAHIPIVAVGLVLIATGAARRAGILLIVATIVENVVLIVTLLVHIFPPACLCRTPPTSPPGHHRSPGHDYQPGSPLPLPPNRQQRGGGHQQSYHHEPSLHRPQEDQEVNEGGGPPHGSEQIVERLEKMEKLVAPSESSDDDEIKEVTNE